MALVFGLVLLGCDNGSTSSGNPFKGTWAGDGYTLVFTDAAYELKETSKGTYTYSGNTAALTQTHEWEDGEWENDPEGPWTASISGNTLELDDLELTKQ
jgi:hypothetical protein